MLDYACPSGHRFESLERRADAPDSKPCPCGDTATRAISAVVGRVKLGEATQGKNPAKYPDFVMDTRPLADGMPLKEWKRERRLKALKERVMADRAKL